jgi:hypothetical protein
MPLRGTGTLLGLHSWARSIKCKVFDRLTIRMDFIESRLDFNEARQQRREILAYVKRQQAEDASCIGHIKAAALEGKRELLWALANWLAAIDTTAPISDRTREAFAKVTDRVSIDIWVELKRKQITFRALVEQAKTQAQLAEGAYNQAAPFGFLSGAFADAAQRPAIQGLKSTRDHAFAVRDAAERDFATNEQALSTVCGSFLRDSQIPDRLRAIYGDAELGALVVPILEMTKQRATELWQTHARKHAKHSSDLEIAAKGLRLFYESPSSSLPPKYLPGEASKR